MIPVRHRGLERLDANVLPRHRVLLPEVVEAVEDAQRLERARSLRGRRQLGDLVAAVAGSERLGPLPRMVPEIRGRERPAAVGHRGGDRLRDRAAVVRVGTVGRERLDRPRERGLPEDRPADDVLVGAHPLAEPRVHRA